MPMDKIINQRSVARAQDPESDDETLADSGFFWRESDGLKVLVCRQLDENGFINGFSTRLGGVSPFPSGDLNLAGFDEDTAENIAENRRRFLAVLGDGLSLATAWQVHGDTIKTIAALADINDSNDKADALISSLDGVIVGVKTADCVPVLIGDPVTRSFAAVHAGWRGTVQSIVKKAVLLLQTTYGSRPGDLICAIGPAACGLNYEVGADVIGQFKEKFSGSDKYFVPTRAGHALVDLHLANRDQLTGTGVMAANISVSPLCTIERPDLFFSYRVEKLKYGKTGRLLSIIGQKTRPRGSKA